ncbi:MAG TPA: hypothetical protein VH761_13310, partial [Ilumatobacteraceae bacterium]
FYRRAHEVKIAAAPADARKFANELFPPLLAKQINDYQDTVANVHGCLRDVAGPRDALAFLIARIETEPRWQSRQGDSGWRRFGSTLAELREEGLLRTPSGNGHVSIKEAVLPFNRFPEVDPALGPEMRSTGEVMGIDATFGLAFYKAELAAGTVLPTTGTVFLSLADGDKPAGIVVARKLRELGLGIAATTGTADYLASFDVPVDAVVGKISDGHGINAVNLIAGGEVCFVINTPQGQGGGARSDGEQIRKAATTHRVSSVTTVEAALAAVQGMAENVGRQLSVRSLQDYHR